MVKISSEYFKRFFHQIDIGPSGLIRSVGLAFLYTWIIKSNTYSMLWKIKDHIKNIKKLKFEARDMILLIILHILDGDGRLSHYSRNPNSALFHRLFRWKKIPEQSTILKFLKRNAWLSTMLNQLLLSIVIKEIVDYCKREGKSEITIDVDQTAREIHGKQQKVKSGYIANKKNENLYQIRIYSVRELKLVMRAKLMPGCVHSSKYFLNEIKHLSTALKKANIKGFFVGDSGFEVSAVCNYLHKNGHTFLFSEKQRPDVKKRGKDSKNKRTFDSDRIMLKERKRPISTKYDYEFREIFIQVLSPDGQLWFDFAADYFTNVFVTNRIEDAEIIYKLYKSHAVIETIIEELKNDFHMGIAHCKVFHVNSAMTVLCAMTYNIKNNFIKEYGIYNKQKEIMKLSTFQSMWIHTPGYIVKHSNRYILKIAKERHNQFVQKLVA